MNSRKIKALLVLAFGYVLFNGFTLNPVTADDVVSNENKDKLAGLVVLNEKAPVEIEYGDENPITELLETINLNIKSQHEEVIDEGIINVNQHKFVAGNKEILLSGYDATKLDLKEVELTIKTKSNNLLEQEQVKKYRVLVHLVDKNAPEITLSEESAEITVGDDFSIEDYIESVVDKQDGTIEEYKIDSEGVNLDEAGEYVYKITATDKSNNEATKEFKITVKEKEEKTEIVNGVVVTTSSRGGSSVAAGSKQSAIYSAAMAQLGRYQDCTALASNALSAAGISFHDWPAGYMALGDAVSPSEAVAGDLIYYANGGTGLAHIAVYAGNGEAIHGGYLGNQTVKASANMGSGIVYIRVR